MSHVVSNHLLYEVLVNFRIWTNS